MGCCLGKEKKSRSSRSAGNDVQNTVYSGSTRKTQEYGNQIEPNDKRSVKRKKSSQSGIRGTNIPARGRFEDSHTLCLSNDVYVTRSNCQNVSKEDAKQLTLEPDAKGMFESNEMKILQTLKLQYFSDVTVISQANFLDVMRQLERAHWFFQDNYVKKDQTSYIFQKSAFEAFIDKCLSGLNIDKTVKFDVKDMVGYYYNHRHSLPVFGAILLNPNLTEILLVKGKGRSWSFPGGKFEKGEDANGVKCAIREVKEEVGIDISKLIDTNYKIEKNLFKSDAYKRNPTGKSGKIYNKRTLYVIQNVNKTSIDETRSNNEIKQIKWWSLKDLYDPENKNIHFVKPFLSELETIVDKLQSPKKKKPKGRRSKRKRRKEKMKRTEHND